MEYIDKFLKDYAEVLRDDHKEVILEHLDFLREYWKVPKTLSKFGDHFTTCPWSKDSTTSGPDSCPCYYIDIYSKRINEIVVWCEKYL